MEYDIEVVAQTISRSDGRFIEFLFFHDNEQTQAFLSFLLMVDRSYIRFVFSAICQNTNVNEPV